MGSPKSHVLCSGECLASRPAGGRVSLEEVGDWATGEEWGMQAKVAGWGAHHVNAGCWT